MRHKTLCETRSTRSTLLLHPSSLTRTPNPSLLSSFNKSSHHDQMSPLIAAFSTPTQQATTQNRVWDRSPLLSEIFSLSSPLPDLCPLLSKSRLGSKPFPLPRPAAFGTIVVHQPSAEDLLSGAAALRQDPKPDQPLQEEALSSQRLSLFLFLFFFLFLGFE